MKKYLLILIPCLLSTAFTFTACQSDKMTAHQLIRANRMDDAKKQFMSPSDINAVDKDGNTVLHLAAQLNDVDLATFFIIKGANQELKNVESETPLHVAIKYDSYDVARILAQTGSNLFARDKDGITCLDLGLATSDDYYNIFINTKAGEIRDTEGQSIVHYFVKTQNIRAIRHCIDGKLPISIRDNNGKTPLDVAFEVLDPDYKGDYGYPNIIDPITGIEIAATLIQGGADEVETDFAYFQDAVSSRNIDTRFDDNQTALHYAAIMNHQAIAQYLLEKGAKTDLQDSSGATPLHEAVRYGNLEIAKMLLDSGANVNAQDNLGKSPVMVIMPREKMGATYKLLAAYKADLTQKDMFGDTVLHAATMMHAPSSVLSLLVSNGADVDAKNKEGVTPFEIAIQHKSKEMTLFYAEQGADIHTKDTHGNSPLSLALMEPDYADDESGESLFQLCVTEKNVHTQDSDGNTPLHIALLNNASYSKIHYIIEKQSDFNIRNSDGNSALYVAIKYYNYSEDGKTSAKRQVGETLLSRKADIFSSNKDSDSPLRIALREGGEVRDWLITSNTIRTTDGSGNTCLHYATEWQYAEAIDFLLTKGADPQAKNANGENVLFSAAKTDNPAIIEQVVRGGTRVNERDNLGATPLHMAVRWDATKSIGKLLAIGIDIDAQNTSGKSALSEAALSGKMATTKTLINYGADVNSSDITGCTILMDAIRGQSTQVVKLLLDSGANAFIQDTTGRNAYHEAALSENIAIINMIRQAGVNPLSRDKNGNTPFSLVLKKRTNVIKSVLGSDKNIVDSDGNSPIHIVVKEKAPSSLLSELIAAGYPVDSRNANGYTALTYAVENNMVAPAVILLENGANPFLSTDKKGRNAAMIALENKNQNMISNIVKFAGEKADVQGNTILHYAARTGSAQDVKRLLDAGVNKDKKNIFGDTPYTIAIRWENFEAMELLK